MTYTVISVIGMGICVVEDRIVSQWRLQCCRTRELEKLRAFAALEFQFHLAKGRRLATRLDLPLVDGEFDLANSTLDRIDRAAHARLEYRLQAAPHLLAEHGSERGVLRDVEVGLPAVDRVLPFVARKQRGAFAAFPLDSLDVAAADAPHSQR